VKRQRCATPLRNRKVNQVLPRAGESGSLSLQLYQALKLQDPAGLGSAPDAAPKSNTGLELLLQGASRLEAEGLLHQAVRIARREGDAGYMMACALLRHGAPHSSEGAAGNSALHEAAHNACSASVTLLLRHGADPNAQNTAGRTPLHAACNPRGDAAGSEQERVIAELLTQGADPRLPDNAGLRASDLLALSRPADCGSRRSLQQTLLRAERWSEHRAALLLRSQASEHPLCQMPEALFQAIAGFL